MFKKEFYFPPVLESKTPDSLFGKKQLALHKISTVQKIGDNTKIIYKLYYSNFSPVFGFLKSETEKGEIKDYYFDTLFDDYNFNFDNVKKITFKSVESIEIEIDEEYVKELFIKNKKEIRKRLIRDKRQMELSSKTGMNKTFNKLRYYLSDLLLP